MATGNQIRVYGKTYQIKADPGAARPKDLAAYVDGKMHALAGTSSKASTLDIAILAALNIAQELFEARGALEEAGKKGDVENRQLAERAARLVQLLTSETGPNPKNHKD